MTEPQKSAGAFAPLRQPVFAVLWAATVLGNIGSFMRDVASSWLVTDLSASPTAVALIQTAATLPIFLLAIPAGVLSDILDRRRFLIFVQLVLAAVSGTCRVTTSAACSSRRRPVLVALNLTRESNVLSSTYDLSFWHPSPIDRRLVASAPTPQGSLPLFYTPLYTD